ncbi:MAG: hypothetical protein HWE25_11595 [Alphaproteobacteria bacterium]|nr:hypothetical protein [Alphaproteobacteria bacterium]
MTKYKITVIIVRENSAATKIFCGRVAWALNELIRVGERGVTPITHPAPRWSAYIHILRGEGLIIETIHEKHGGRFPGTHGRYILRSIVHLVHANDND